MSRDDASKRPYDNTRRRELANETRDRIVEAGLELLRQSTIRDWRGVTIRAVAERAAVNERTVYRHFANEQALREAIMYRLELEVGVNLPELQLSGVADTAARLFTHVASYPRPAPPALDETLVAARARVHDALLAAVKNAAGSWSTADRTLAAAALDLLWAVGSQERLVRDWGLDDEEAIRAVTWVIGLVEEAIRSGRRPPGPKASRPPARAPTRRPVRAPAR